MEQFKKKRISRGRAYRWFKETGRDQKNELGTWWTCRFNDGFCCMYNNERTILPKAKKADEMICFNYFREMTVRGVSESKALEGKHGRAGRQQRCLRARSSIVMYQA